VHLVMFDIDGTLVDTSAFEDYCFVRAVSDVLDIELSTDWSCFQHVSDSGIVDELLRDIESNARRQRASQKIRTKFIELVKGYLREHSAPEIPGAAYFLKELGQRDDTVLCLATGGWKPTAQLKLKSAGIDYSNIALASSDDHYDRVEIMKIAEKRAGEFDFESKTYFGDGIWDKRASHALGYNFVLVGEKADHDQRILNYNDGNKARTYIGL